MELEREVVRLRGELHAARLRDSRADRQCADLSALQEMENARDTYLLEFLSAKQQNRRMERSMVRRRPHHQTPIDLY